MLKEITQLLEEIDAKIQITDPAQLQSFLDMEHRMLKDMAEKIIKSGAKVPELKSAPKYEVLFIGVKHGMRELKELIKTRLVRRLKIGMVKEVINLKKSGLSWKRLEDLGLEYRYIAYYLQNKLSYDEMVKKLQKEIEHYAKRQMTWFSKNKKIIWIKNQSEAQKKICAFLS